MPWMAWLKYLPDFVISYSTCFSIFIDMKQLLLIFSLLFLSLTCIEAQTPSPVVPDFHFLEKKGTLFTRKQLPAGKPVFFIYFDITCEHCMVTMQYLNTRVNMLQKAAVYLVTADQGSQAEAFLNLHAPQLFRMSNTLLLRDTRQQFIPLFRPRKYPSLFLYSPQQQLLLYSDEEKDLDTFLEKIRSWK